jgi:hypothetical protein
VARRCAMGAKFWDETAPLHYNLIALKRVEKIQVHRIG